MRECGFNGGRPRSRIRKGVNASDSESEDTNVPRNPAGVRFDPRAPLLNVLAIMESEGGKEVMLAAINPESGYQRGGSEMTPPLVVRRQKQLVNDEVNDVLRNVHRVGVEIVGILVRDSILHSRRGGRRNGRRLRLIRS